MSTLRDKAAPRPARVAAPAVPARGPARSGRLEVAGHVLVAAGLFFLLAYHVRQVDAFFLDDWLYTHLAEYVWQHLPGAIYGDVPGWTRGAQRLYPIAISPFWGGLDPSTAATTSHLFNALLTSSAVVPAALLARRLIETPLLRVLAVALALVLPFLTVTGTLLTENLVLPLLLWAVYLIARAADSPTLLNQIGVLVAIAALALTRLNLAVTVAALAVTVVVAELWSGLRSREPAPIRVRLARLVRRRAPLLLALVAAIAAGVLLLGSRASVVGSQYGDSSSLAELKDIFTAWDAVRAAVATYTRSLVTGTFVFPFVLALAAALAAARGAFGRRPAIVAIAALTTFAVLLVTVAAITKEQVLEERYAFYAYVPVALFAVAGVERLRRIPVELAIASAVAVWALDTGAVRPATVYYNFFEAPGGAFWTRVVEHRLVRLEGALPGEPTGWILIAVGLAVLVALALAARLIRLPRHLPLMVVGGGLALCLVAQALALNYGFRSLLHGLNEAPGGLAGAPGHEQDRVEWIDEGLPDGARAVHLAPMATPGAPFGGAETTQYWNRRIDAVLALRFTGAGVVASAGHSIVESQLVNGLATWQGPAPGWVAGAADDPRLQFAGEVTRPPVPGGTALTRLDQPVRSVWTTSGLEPDGYLPADATATMTLARGRGEDAVREVRLRMRGPDALPGRIKWRIERTNRRPLRGRLSAAQSRTVRLEVPPCLRSGTCQPVSWKLTWSGEPAMVVLPVYGPQPPPRPVGVQVLEARLVRG